MTFLADRPTSSNSKKLDRYIVHIQLYIVYIGNGCGLSRPLIYLWTRASVRVWPSLRVTRRPACYVSPELLQILRRYEGPDMKFDMQRRYNPTCTVMFPGHTMGGGQRGWRECRVTGREGRAVTMGLMTR